MIEEHCNAMEHNVEHNGSNAENMNAVVRGIVWLRYCARLIVQHINWTTTQQRYMLKVRDPRFAGQKLSRTNLIVF